MSRSSAWSTSASGLVTAAIAFCRGGGRDCRALCSGALWPVLNYIPYIGPAVVASILLILESSRCRRCPRRCSRRPCSWHLPQAEGHFITPSLIGQQLTVSPLALFLSLAFWTWLWGPLGTFLAAPILIAATVVQNYVFGDDEPKLPGERLPSLRTRNGADVGEKQTGGRSGRPFCCTWSCDPDAAQQRQDHDDHQDRADDAAGTIAPAAAVPPRRQCADQNEDQYDDQ